MEHYKNLFVTVLITITIYLILFLTFQPYLTNQEIVSLGKGRRTIIESGNLELHILIVIIVIILGVFIYILLNRSNKQNNNPAKLNHKEIAYKVLKKALSNDEKKIINELKKSKEVTQDSLRFRLEWSKAKLSAILTGLDRKGIIQRERTGKTYKVKLDRKFK